MREGRVEEAKVMWSVLSELGAKLDSADGQGRTAVWMAAMSGEVEVVRVLRELGARAETPPSRVRTHKQGWRWSIRLFEHVGGR